MGRMLWINPALGVAGNMLLGALLDAGADEGSVREALGRLQLPGWELRVGPVMRRSIRCLLAEVAVAAEEEHRPWSGIDRLIAGAGLAAPVADGARATFLRLADVEAQRHDVARDEVQFHEVGATDAIVDVVGCWAALHALGVDEVHSAAVGLSAGTVTAAHGELPGPAPATIGLLAGAEVRGVVAGFETATPTGAALLATMVSRWGPPPEGTLAASGFGAGGHDPDSHANLLNVVVIDSAESATVDAVVVETTVDDVTPEVLGHVLERVLAAGADDAWIVPVIMKKGRPGHELRVLCSPALVADVGELVAAETGTLGVRSRPVSKRVLERRFEEVTVAGETVRVKVGPYGAKPEHDDLARVAAATGRPLREVAADAAAAWRHRKEER